MRRLAVATKIATFIVTSMSVFGPGALRAYSYMLLWMVLSGAVVMINKWILDPKLGGWSYPLCLTAIHQAFCSTAATALSQTRHCDAPVAMTRDLFVSAVVPVGILFAVTLWLSNTAYVYLSVSFVQMLKAAAPLTVYAVGCVFGTDTLGWKSAFNVVLVVAGVVLATYGEFQFVLVGVLAQTVAIFSEAFRLVLVQKLLHGTNVKLTPMTFMCYVSPVCFLALLGPALLLEMPKLMVSGNNTASLLVLWAIGLSALIAFALNMSVLLVISASSALVRLCVTRAGVQDGGHPPAR